MEEEELLNSVTLKDGFAGNRRFLKGFLAKINLIFMLYPVRYHQQRRNESNISNFKIIRKCHKLGSLPYQERRSMSL